MIKNNFATTCQRANNTMDWTIPTRCAIVFFFFGFYVGTGLVIKIGSAKSEKKENQVSATVSRERKELADVYDIVK